MALYQMFSNLPWEFSWVWLIGIRNSVSYWVGELLGPIYMRRAMDYFELQGKYAECKERNGAFRG